MQTLHMAQKVKFLVRAHRLPAFPLHACCVGRTMQLDDLVRPFQRTFPTRGLLLHAPKWGLRSKTAMSGHWRTLVRAHGCEPKR